MCLCGFIHKEFVVESEVERRDSRIVLRGVLGVLRLLWSTLLPENRTPGLKMLLARTTLC